MSAVLIITGFYVHFSGGEDITLDSVDRTSDVSSYFDEVTTQEVTSIIEDTTDSATEPFTDATEVSAAIESETAETTIEETTAEVTTSEETTAEETTAEETTAEETTAEETTTEETTAEETTAEETTAVETTAEETTAVETTAEETTAVETTAEETTSAPETTEHVHSFSGWKTVSMPTCEKDGKRARSCSCGEKQERPIEAIGHTIIKLSAVAATCQKSGLTAGEKCSVCNKTFVKQTVIQKLTCKFENSVCIYCGRSETYEIKLTTEFAGLYRADTLEALYSLNANQKVAPASLTKMVTACVAIENMPLNTVITVGSELSLVPKNSSLAYIYKGQRIKLSDLLTGMLLCSGNDAAYTIAANVGRYASGNSTLSDKQAVEYFCALMNDYVKELGLKNTNFTTPDGSDNDGQYSTVSDLAVITSHAMKNKTIADITSTHYQKVVFVSGQIAKWTNTNELIDPESPYYTECVNGFKTGGTEDAGKCLSATFTKNGVKYIAIVMGCEDNDARYENILELINIVK